MRKLKYGLYGTAAALALAIAVPALSQAGPGKGGHGAMMFEQADTDGSGDISKAEMQAASEKRFADADANGDGVLMQEEMAAAHEKMRVNADGRRGDPAERFAAADADGDGKLTLDEMKAAAAARMAERGKEGAAAVKEITGGVGADAVLECVGTDQAMGTAFAVARPGATVGFVGVPHGVELPVRRMFQKNVGLAGGMAPVREYLPHLLGLVLDGTIEPGKVFDATLPMDQVAEGYKMMDERRAIKVLLEP